jgi:hypothetical protein
MELEILDVIFDVSNEIEDIVSDPDKMFNGLYVALLKIFIMYHEFMYYVVKISHMW